LSLQSTLKLLSIYLIVGVTVVLLVVGFAYAYGIYVVQVSPTPRPEGEVIVVPSVLHELEINWSEVGRLIREHPLANQLRLDRAVETPIEYHLHRCIIYRYPESTWATIDHMGFKALFHVDKVVFCAYIDFKTKAYNIILYQIIAYPGFNIEDVPPEYNDMAFKAVKLVYERSRKLYGEPEKVGLTAIIKEGSSMIAYAVAVVGKERHGFTVDLTKNTVSERFLETGAYLMILNFPVITASERE